MAYPSIITSFPQPTASSRLNNPSHSALENLQSSTIAQIQAVIGLADSSSILGTLIGDLRSPGSQGGGHIQGAAFGGTGQTNYSKGNLVVATSASVLSKLAIGTDLQVLQADSSQAAGLKWANVISNKITVRTSVVSLASGFSSVMHVLFTASIAANTLSTANAIKYTGTIDSYQMTGGNTFQVDLQYGNQSVATLQVTNPNTMNSGSGMKGTVSGMIVGNGATNDQKGYLSVQLGNSKSGLTASTITAFNLGGSSVNSTLNQDLFINALMDGGGGGTTSNSILGTIFVVEKIA